MTTIAKRPTRQRQGHVKARVVELLGGILPGNDGQELDNEEVTALGPRSSATRRRRRAAAVPRPGRRTPGQPNPDVPILARPPVGRALYR